MPAFMDQGVAAMLGAIVGVGGATVTAAATAWGLRWQSRAQARTAHLQWQRQARREAYLGFLHAGGRLSRENAHLRDAVNAPNAAPPVTFETDWCEALHSSRVGLIDAARVVDLEGPESLVDVVRAVVAQAWRLTALADELAARGQPEPEDAECLRNVHKDVAAELKRFRTTARLVLGEPHDFRAPERRSRLNRL